MARTVSIGYQEFDELISQNFFYIDKTHTDGTTYKVLAGSSDPNVYEYIQIY